MIRAHPFLGVGLNNTLDQKRNYLNLTYYPGDPDMHFYEEPTHNVYLSMASEIGVLATLLFVAFFANATVVAWRQSRGSPDPETRLAANALVVAFCSAALNGMMDPLDENSRSHAAVALCRDQSEPLSDGADAKDRRVVGVTPGSENELLPAVSCRARAARR